MSRRRREVSEEERTLFRETVAGGAASKAKPERKAEPATPKTRDAVQPSVAAGATRGLDGRTAERLRRGQIEPDERLDLHGMTEAAAHRALLGFLKAAHRRGARLVLVVTGKGVSLDDDAAPFNLELVRRSRGVLKTMAPRWLSEPEFAPHVAEIRAAHRRHGGAGALYVYLRKKPR